MPLPSLLCLLTNLRPCALRYMAILVSVALQQSEALQAVGLQHVTILGLVRSVECVPVLELVVFVGSHPTVALQQYEARDLSPFSM